MKMKKIVFVVLGIMFFCLTLGPAFSEQEEATKEDYIVARIADEPLYFSEIDRAALSLNRFLRDNFENSQSWRVNYIRQYIAQTALAVRAEHEGLHEDSETAFDLKRARSGILAEKILQDRLEKLVITQEEFKKHYEENKAMYQIKEKIRVSYVKINSKKKADNFIQDLNKGKTFKSLAKKKEIKIEGWISKDSPGVPELSGIDTNAINNLTGLGVGGSSQPIEKSGEFYIFHVNEKEEAKDRPYEEVASQVEFEVTKKVRDKTVNDFILETFALENVKVYEDRIK